MSTLQQLLGTEPTKAKVVADCAALVDNQVRAKGFIIKGAYAAVKTIKSNFVPDVIAALLPDWLRNMEPHYEAWHKAGRTGAFADFLTARSSLVAEDLLKVTDVRAEKTSHTTAKKAYFKLRESAKQHVVDAVPELARAIQRHLPTA